MEIEEFAFDLEVVGWGRSPILVPVTEARASATKAESAAAVARTAAVHLLTAIRSYTERTHS